MLGTLTFLFFSLIIIFADKLQNNVKKIKMKDSEIEFNTKEKKQFANIAFELLEKNFPKLTEISQKEVEKRVETWTKQFLDYLEGKNISLKEFHLFYDPDFQFVLSKAIELVGRKNDALLNKALIVCLTSRIKYNDSQRDDLITQLDSVIINDIPRLSENHFKLMCLTKLLQDIDTILSIKNYDDFVKIVLPCIEQFLITDVRCYADLCNTVIISNGGNIKLLSSQRDGFVEIQSGKIPRPPKTIDNLFQYFSNVYAFFKTLTSEQKQELMNNDIFKDCDTLFKHVLRYILIYPIGENIINEYGMKKINEVLENIAVTDP